MNASVSAAPLSHKSLSRKQFLGGLGGIGGSLALAGGALAAGALPAGASASEASAADAGASENELLACFDSGVETSREIVDPRYDVDVCIVGCGSAGMAAAIEAAQAGLSTLLVEAGAVLGGTSQFAEGILGVSTPIQQSLGISNDVAKLVEGELTFSNYVADPLLIKPFVEAADEDIAWLRGMGVQFYEDVIGGNLQHLYMGQGRGMFDTLEPVAREAGAQILTSTRGKRLFLEGGSVGGAVCGLVAEDEGGEFDIRAKAVILACGGFIQNDAMMSQLMRYDFDRIKVTAAANHLGDDLNMAYSAGGDRSGVSTLHFIWAGLADFDLHSELSCAACNEPYFMVNSEGRRFCDESILLIGTEDKGPSVICNPIMNQRKAFSILSQAEVDRLAVEGSTAGWGSYIFAGTPLEKLQSQLDEAVAEADAPGGGKAGFWHADTIEALAVEMGVDPQALCAEVDSYNAMCDAGVDTEMGKPAEYLRKVEGGPFYAFELMCNAFATMGGVRVNEKGEVLDANRAPIPGLYNAGISCSGLQGTTYCINLGGGAQAYAVYSGRNCVRSAMAYMGK